MWDCWNGRSQSCLSNINMNTEKFLGQNFDFMMNDMDVLFSDIPCKQKPRKQFGLFLEI